MHGTRARCSCGAARLLLLCWVLAAALGGGAARGAPATPPSLQLAPASATPGAVVLVSGRGFPPLAALTLLVDGAAAGSTRADAAGRLAVAGIQLPPGIAAGTHRVGARDRRGVALATALLRVAPLHPTLRVTSGPARPGSTVRVAGAGFLPREPIALALDGAGVEPTAGMARGGLRAGPDGAFQVELSAPDGLLAGANTLAASGATSRRTAVTPLLGDLPVRSSFLFAGASTAGGARPSLALLNAGDLPAAVTVELLPAPGETGLRLRVMVRARARATLELRPLASGRQFGLRIRADRRIAAQLVEEGVHGSWSIQPVVAARTGWLLAEGYTGQTFRETLAVLNPGARPAQVRLSLLPGNGEPAMELTLLAPAGKHLLVDLNRIFPRRALSVIAVADRPVVLARILRFGGDGQGVTTSVGSPLASTTWLFAAGDTSGRMRTYLTVLNPNATAAAVTASFYDPGGRPLGNRTIRVEGKHRGTLLVNDLLRRADFATFVTGSEPVVVERALYTGDPNGTSGAGVAVLGANGAASAASFADGGGGAGGRELLLLLNPSAKPVLLRIECYPAGATPRPILGATIRIPALARTTVEVGRAFPGLPAGPHGTLIRLRDGVGFVAEQMILAPDGRGLRATAALAQ